MIDFESIDERIALKKQVAELTCQRDELAAALDKAREAMVAEVRYGRDVECLNRALRETADPSAILAAREKTLRDALEVIAEGRGNLGGNPGFTASAALVAAPGAKPIDRVAHLRNLPQGWNGPDSPAVSEAALKTASVVLSTPGHAVPAHNGGIQIEWHEQGIDFEFVIAPDGREEEAAPEAKP